MKKLLFIIGLIALFSCEKPMGECKHCYHMTTVWGDGFSNSQRWGEFMACGDTAVILNGVCSYVYTEDTDSHSVDVIICE